MNDMICPACSNKQFKEEELIPNLLYKKTCLTCRLLISDIKQPGQTGLEATNEEAYDRSINLVRQRQSVEVTSYVKQFTEPSGKDWLDVGCGVGNLLHEAKRAGFRVFGVEPQQRACERARSLVGNEAVHHGLMNEAAVPDNSFDIISTMDVLEHIPVNSLPDFARMLHRKLRAHGLWCIKVPSTDGLYFKVSHSMLRLVGSPIHNVIKRMWMSEAKFPHTVYFNQQTLQRYLETHSFKVIGYCYLEEVPTTTVLDRLTLTGTIPRYQALLFAPGFYLINFIERMRDKSDALLMLAQRQ